jgi:hypothetical protein
MHLEDGVDGEAGDALDPGNGEAGELAVVEHSAHRLHQLRHLYQPVPACLQAITLKLNWCCHWKAADDMRTRQWSGSALVSMRIRI